MMTNEKRKKIGIIGGAVLLAICVANNATVKLPAINAGALVLFAITALIAAGLYIRDNGPLPQREMMKEAALIILILVLLVFSATSAF